MLTPATRITSTRELLGAVPTLIGFRPTQSLVLLGFMQSTSRLGPTLRVDLPASQDVVTELATRLRHYEVGSVVAIVYSDDVDTDAEPSALAAAIARTFITVGLTVLDVWHVGPTLFRCLTPAGDRQPGTAGLVDDLDHDPLVTEMVGRGTPLATGTREDVLTCLTPQPAAERATRARAVRMAAQDLADHTVTLSQAFQAWKAETAPAATGTSAPAPSEETVGLLLAALAVDVFRDAVLMDILSHGDPRASELLTAESTTAHLHAVLDGVFSDPAARPDPEATSPRRRLLEHLAQLAPDQVRAHPLAVLALTTWWHNELMMAATAARDALTVDPACRLAVLISTAIDAACLPAWVKASVRKRHA
ncbi:DUF4192 domain-containing protein [Klenkia sp. PcliD-1-E]|uniref:DUF4192 domain-containing protein n=1 Tax=Klenkia sp. PcliD-1-E TaxID=2954492 RepID=UPI002097890D|nr:DUF4192 domain-containing protein [Klenkia sp. PcliD-1-E]MCO7219482.1 DUF4192 domain-containing protein [Klenkia sp. PcliD-1-E]